MLSLFLGIHNGRLSNNICNDGGNMVALKIRFLLLTIILFLMSKESFAQTLYYPNYNPALRFTTELAACQDYATHEGANPATASISAHPSGRCYFVNNVGNGVRRYVLPVSASDCPSGKTWNNTTQACEFPPITCTYPKIKDVATNTCITDCSSLKGATTSWFSTVGTGSDQCMEGCTVQMAEGSCAYNVSGAYGCTFTGIYKNESCTASPPSTTPSNDPAFECVAQGKSYGTVNGTTVCVDKGSDGAAPVTEIDKSGSSTTVDGATTFETSQTTCEGENCTTTTVTTNPDLTTSTKTETKPLKTFCEENPNAKLCKGEDSSFAGSCGAFSCTGDAVQCAMAKEQHKRNCTLFDTSTALSDLGNSAAAGTDSGSLDNPAKLSNRTTLNIAPSLDESNGGITGTLHNVDVGFGITLPFEKLIPFLTIMGYIALAFAYFKAYKIVGGAI